MSKILEIAQIALQVPLPGQPPPIIIPAPNIVARGLTLAEIGSLIAIVGSFLTSIGVLLAIIAIIVSGIMYMKAGDKEANITKAKGWFKNVLIGALIILAVGVIINTIANVVSREFFCRAMVDLIVWKKCIF